MRRIFRGYLKIVESQLLKSLGQAMLVILYGLSTITNLLHCGDYSLWFSIVGKGQDYSASASCSLAFLDSKTTKMQASYAMLVIFYGLSTFTKSFALPKIHKKTRSTFVNLASRLFSAERKGFEPLKRG